MCWSLVITTVQLVPKARLCRANNPAVDGGAEPAGTGRRACALVSVPLAPDKCSPPALTSPASPVKSTLPAVRLLETTNVPVPFGAKLRVLLPPATPPMADLLSR